MPLIVFLAALVHAVIGAMTENAYHAGDWRAAGVLSFLSSLIMGGIGFAVIAEKSIPNLIAQATAWAIGMSLGSYWRTHGNSFDQGKRSSG